MKTDTVSNPGAPTTPTTPLSDNILSRYGRDIGDYLKSPDTDFSPAIIGALLGGGAGALYTARNPGESTKRRAMRIMRNALIGGALGGAGTQAAAYGLGRIGAAVSGENKRKPTGLELFIQSLGGRTTAGAAGLGMAHGTSRLLGNRVRALENLFGTVSKTEPSMNILNRDIELTREGQRAKGPLHSKQVEPVSDKNNTIGYKARKRFFEQKLRPFVGSKVETPYMGAYDSVGSLRKHILANTDINELQAMFGTKDHARLQKSIDSYLHRHGVGIGGASLGGRALLSADRLLNPNYFSTSRASRTLGRGVGIGSLAGGLFLPEIIGGVSESLGDVIGDRRAPILTPAIPDVGPVPDQEKGILNRIFGQPAF